jgi:hypothetical protein
METSSEIDKVSEQKIEEFWRPATADDVARVMRGERVEARFRDESRDDWACGVNSFLAGGVISHREVITWISKTTIRWNECQVYDPPAWFVNKPDPGEGYRLLEKFPPEDLWSSDEAWNDIAKAWELTARLTQCETLWYRRRIETNSPTSSDSSRSRDTIPSGWRLLGKDEDRLASDAYWSLGAKDWIIIGDDRVADANEFGKWRAIRQMDRAYDFYLVEKLHYKLPNGSHIRITEKGFEVG